MNFPQKRNVNVAAVSKRKHDLSHSHIGTTDFGRIKPIECRYMVPGDEFNINVANETRVLNAMPSPTIGKFDVIYRSFFVPINHVWSPFYDFIKNQQTSSSDGLVTVSEPPYVLLSDILLYFFDTRNGLITKTDEEPASYDYLCYNNGTEYFCSFTRKGRILFDFLNSLGINIPFGLDYTNSSEVNIKLYIVLPLICFWKFYFDWIVPSRFIHEHQDYIDILIKKLSSTPNIGRVSQSDFFLYLVHEPLAYYLDDIFTTSTEFPFQGEEILSEPIIITNPSSDTSVQAYGDTLSPNTGAHAFGDSDDGLIYNFNMYTLQTLGKLQDLLNRNLIAGTKVQDWLLTEFGIRPSTDALHLSTYLGSKRSSFNVSDVISNADTEAQGGVPLGAYGGYVRNNSQFDFSYKSDEHGFFFITYELVPKTSYYQGLVSQFDMGNRFDFFQPEFDNQQGEPIPFRRLFFSHNNYAEQSTRFDRRFGFSMQYSGFKYAPDIVSGDFRTRFGKQLKSWFLARDMEYISETANNINGIDEEFCLVKSKYQDWHYIFSDMNDELDPFLVAFHFQYPAMRPMKSVTEVFEPTYQQSGKNVQLDFSGSVK